MPLTSPPQSAFCDVNGNSTSNNNNVKPTCPIITSAPSTSSQPASSTTANQRSPPDSPSKSRPMSPTNQNIVFKKAAKTAASLSNGISNSGLTAKRHQKSPEASTATTTSTKSKTSTTGAARTTITNGVAGRGSKVSPTTRTTKPIKGAFVRFGKVFF